MNINSDSLFYAKILLFGEYGIIRDSMGLSIPYSTYGGSFEFAENAGEFESASQNALRNYLNHLELLKAEKTLPCEMKLDAFKDDLAKGMYFNSSIPQGFGVGSSGALVAAVYNRYAINPSPKKANLLPKEIADLKQILGKLESYFHGKSSGLDPLICYLQLPVLIKSGNELGTVELPTQSLGNAAIFLINSGHPGSTQTMVEIFMENMKNDGFRKMLKNQFIKHNDACIKAFVKGELRSLFSHLKKLSQVLLDNFSPMIPENFHGLWKQGIESGDYYLKLCGSGGGGFILGFTEDYSKVEEVLYDYHPILIQKL